jgi:hypothetical protein
MKNFLIVALLCLGAGMFSRGASAQTMLNLADCSQSSLQTEWNAMSSGAYVLVFPSCAAGGTGLWTSTLSLTVPAGVTSVTIEGQTTVSCVNSPGTATYSCSATDNTVIEDNTAVNSPSFLTFVTGSPSSSFRITGMTIGYGPSGLSKNNGLVDFWGSTNNFRFDHSHELATTSGYIGYEIDGQIEGVFDHDVFDLGNASSYTAGVRIENDLFDSVGNDDGGYEAATDWGSQHFIFIESSQINGGYSNDCDHAGRIVERYDTFKNTQDAMEAHPTKDYSGASRGCRALEFYHNYINTNSTFAVLGGQSGTWMVWGNTVVSTTASWFWAGSTYRSCPSCNGVPPGNHFPPNGWGQCGSDMNYPGTPGTPSPWDGNSSTVTGYPCIDNLGRGQQQQDMNGANFPDRVNNASGTQTWPQQYLEPLYLFDNTLPAGLYTQEFLAQDYTTSLNRDSYVDNSSCAGSGCSSLTSGTGYGTLAERPSTCTPGPGGTYGVSPTGSYGVGYWATDANGGNGELYVCTAPNTWTGIYSPYTYPNPIVNGGGGGGTVTLSPASQNMGSVNVGSTSGNFTFTLTNGSANSIPSLSATITGTNQPYFANTGGGTCGSTLASMASCTEILNFTPGAPGTGFSATLKVSYTGGDGNGSVSAGLTGSGVSSCSNPVSVNGYTICSSAWNEASSPNTTVTVPFTPYAGNSVELFVQWCVVGCNANATQTVTISDNVNNPETCFVEAPHSGYQAANTGVPDYPIIHAYFCPSIPSGVTQLTATVSASVDFLSINPQEIKAGQIASSSYFETVDQGQASGNTAGTTATVSTSATTANASDLVTALLINCGGNINATPGSGYTGITVNPVNGSASDPGWVLEDKGITSVGVQTATSSWSSGTASGGCAVGAGAPNTTWFGAIVALKAASGTPTLNPPAISPASGTYSSPTVVTITASAGTTICWRDDGIAPSATTPGTCDAGSTTYSGPFGVTIPAGGVTVEALATEANYTNSSVASVNYALVPCSNTALGAAWTCVGYASNANGTAGLLPTGPLSNNPPAGALINVFIFGPNACATPTGQLGESFALISSPTQGSYDLCQYWGLTTGSGVDSITCSVACNGISAQAFSVSSGTISLDKSCTRSNATTSSGSNNATCSASITNTNNNELIVATTRGAATSTLSPGTNFALVDGGTNGLRDEYYMQASSSAITPSETLDTGVGYGFMAASFTNGGGGSGSPVITSVSPASGPPGTLAKISGTGFGTTQGSSTVTFGSITSGFCIWANTALYCWVPPGGSGNVVVTVSGAKSGGVPFTVTPTPIVPNGPL